MVGDPPAGPEVVGRPFQRSGSGRETLTEVRNWSGDPHGGPELVVRSSHRSGSGRKTLPNVRKWSGDPPGGPEVVGILSRSYRSSRRPSRSAEVVGRPSRRSGSSWETLPEVRKGSETLPEVWNW